MFDCVIIGGGTAGMTAAIYLLRAGKSAMILESTALGGQITASARIENFPGLLGVSGIEYADKLAEQVFHFGGQIEPVEVKEVRKEGDHFMIETTDDERYEAKSVIIATGAAHRHLGLPREEELPGVSYCAVCDGAIFKDKEVVLVGGGNSAVEDAVYLSNICKKVTVINNLPTFTCQEGVLKEFEAQKADKQNIVVNQNSCVLEIIGENQVEAVKFLNDDGKEVTLNVDGVFIAIGRTPDTKVVRNSIHLDEHGYIATDENLETNQPGVFACGDVRVKELRQIITACADGAIAATNANSYITNND